MIENFKSENQPFGSEDARDQDAFMAAMPFILQLSPDINTDNLDEIFHCLTTNEETLKILKVQAKLLGKFIEDDNDTEIEEISQENEETKGKFRIIANYRKLEMYFSRKIMIYILQPQILPLN